MNIKEYTYRGNIDLNINVDFWGREITTSKLF